MQYHHNGDIIYFPLLFVITMEIWCNYPIVDAVWGCYFAFGGEGEKASRVSVGWEGNGAIAVGLAQTCCVQCIGFGG